MIRNLILAIFLMGLALPAFAMPVASHDEPVAQAIDCHGMPVQQDEHDRGTSVGQTHGCIGCIAPNIDMPLAPIIALLPFIAEAPPEQKLTGTVPPPSLPPPRI